MERMMKSIGATTAAQNKANQQKHVTKEIGIHCKQLCHSVRKSVANSMRELVRHALQFGGVLASDS
eukprot:1670152-Amphidinium_carterae.1